MCYKLKSLGRFFIGLDCAVALVLVAGVYGCGGSDRSSKKNLSEKAAGEHDAIEAPSSIAIGKSTQETIAKEDTSVLPAQVSNPEPPMEVTFEEAEAAYNQGRYDEALELFALYTERKSENAWGFYMLGLSARKAGDYESAQEAFNKALSLDPDHVKSFLNLSRVLLDIRKPEEALDNTNRALSLDESSSAAYRLQGLAFYQLGETEKSLEAYRRAIKLDPEDAWSMNNMGLIFIEEEDFDRALPCLARAVELREDVAIFQNNLGMALERTGYFRDAEEAYKRAFEIDDTYEKASMNQSRIEQVRGDPDVELVDLSLLAQSFVDEIEKWKELQSSVDQVDDASMIIDTLLISNADSSRSREQE